MVLLINFVILKSKLFCLLFQRWFPFSQNRLERYVKSQWSWFITSYKMALTDSVDPDQTQITGRLISVCIICHDILGIERGFSGINIRQVPREKKTTTKDMFDRYYCIETGKKNATFRVISCTILFRFSQMSRERNFHELCSFLGRAVHISWRQQFCGPGTVILKFA